MVLYWIVDGRVDAGLYIVGGSVSGSRFMGWLQLSKGSCKNERVSGPYCIVLGLGNVPLIAEHCLPQLKQDFWMFKDFSVEF